MKAILNRISFLALALTAATILNAGAQVTTAPGNNGTNISADNGSTASSPVWTTLGNIVMTETSKSDFGTGATKIVLNAPLNWKFNTTGVSASATGGNVTVGTVSSTATAVTINITVGGTNKTDVLTISGVQVECTSGTVLNTSVNITATVTTTGSINGVTNGSTNFGTLSQVAGSLAKLVVSQSIATQTAGTSFNMGSLTAEDQFGNTLSTANGNDFTGTVALSTNAAYGSVSPSTSSAFVNGVLSSQSVTVTQATSQTITATSGSVTGTSNSFTTNVGAFNQLEVVMPGETAAPGSAGGTSGSPTAQTAGTACTITVYACDANWNVVTTGTGYNHTVAITSSDANATLPANAALAAGTKTFSVTFKTAASQTVTATDQTTPKGSPNTGDATTVNAGAFTQLEVVMPGETIAPGTSAGTIGSPTAQTAGTACTISVYACDANWNVVTTGTGYNHTVAITSTDASAVLPANAALAAGVKTFSITFKTSGSQTATATDQTTPKGSPNTGDATTVSPATYSSFTFAAIGTQTAGTAFTTTITAKDVYGNTATGFSGTVTLSTNATYGSISPTTSSSFVNGVLTNQSITVTQATSQTITATNGSATGNTTIATVNVGAFTQLEVVMPGETAAPGSAGGTTGSPTAQTAGTACTITVYACDANWNVVTTGTGYNHTVAITSTDASAVLPANAALAAGVKTFSVTFKTSGSQTATATDQTTPKGSPNTGDATTVNAATASSFTFGAIATQTAGTAFSVTITAKDAYGNTTTSFTGTAVITTTAGTITPSTSNAFSAGVLTQSFTVTLSGSGKTITATSTTPSATGTYSSFTVNPGLASAFTFGVIGTQTEGTAFSVTMTAKDANGNVATGFTGTAAMTTNGGTITPATSNAFSAGVLTQSFTLTQAGSKTITATSSSPSANGTCTAFTVNAGAFSKLQILLPGETAAAGTTTGKTGSPSSQTQDASFIVTVNGVDANWNIVSTATDNIHLVSSDGATMPANTTLSSGTASFSVTLFTTGSKTITASDVTNGGITSNTSASFTLSAFASVNSDYFRSNATGNWSTPATWQGSHDNVNWYTATLSPDYNSAGITLQSPNTITLTSSVTADGVVINSGAQLNINDNITLTLNNGGGTDMDVYGTVEEIGTGSTGASIDVTSGAAIVFENGGTYLHNFSSTSTQGSVPTATWSTGSMCEIIGFTSGTTIHIGNLTQNFYNFEWNCPNQTSGYGLTATLTTVRGTFTMANSGSTPQAVYGLGINTLNFTMNVGNISITGGFFDFTSSGASGSFFLNIAGSYSQTGGTFQSDYAGTGLTTVSFTGANQTFNQSAGTLTTTNMNIYVASGASLTLGSNFPVTSSSVSTLTVSSGGTLYTGTNAVSGSGLFTLSSGGTLGMGSLSGVNGNITTTSKSLSTGGNYIYNGSGAQNTGSQFPSTIASLTVANSSSGTLTVTNAGTLTVTSALTLTSGLVANSGTVIYVTNAATTSVTGYSSSSYIEGTLQRAVNSTGSYYFPVGNSSNYELAILKLNSSSGITYLTANYNSGLPATLPVFPTSNINSTSSVTSMLNSGYWTITPNTTTYTVNYDVTIYESGYTNNGFAASQMGMIKRHNSSDAWHGTNHSEGYDGLQGYSNDSTQTIVNGYARAKRTGVQGFSDYGIAFGSTALPITLTGFEATAQGNKIVNVSWNTEAEINSNYYAVERSADAVNFVQIGTVAASGTSYTVHNYEFADNNPLIGTSYYRLREVDNNDSSTYSTISAVKIYGTNSVTLYPNPTVDVINVRLDNNSLNKIRIMGVDGKIYIQENYSNDESIISISVSQLPAGMYILVVDNGTSLSTTKFLKQ